MKKNKKIKDILLEWLNDNNSTPDERVWIAKLLMDMRKENESSKL